MDEQRVLLKEKLGPCVVRELAILHQTASIELQTNVTEYILDNYMTDELLVVLQDVRKSWETDARVRVCK